MGIFFEENEISKGPFYDFIETGSLYRKVLKNIHLSRLLILENIAFKKFYDDLSYRCRCEFKCGGTTFAASSNEQLTKQDARAVCNMNIAKILYRENMVPSNPFVFDRERFETLFTESDSGFSEPGISYFFEPRQWIKDFETKNCIFFAAPTKFKSRTKLKLNTMTVTLKSKRKPMKASITEHVSKYVCDFLLLEIYLKYISENCEALSDLTKLIHEDITDQANKLRIQQNHYKKLTKILNINTTKAYKTFLEFLKTYKDDVKLIEKQIDNETSLNLKMEYTFFFKNENFKTCIEGTERKTIRNLFSLEALAFLKTLTLF